MNHETKNIHHESNCSELIAYLFAVKSNFDPFCNLDWNAFATPFDLWQWVAQNLRDQPKLPALVEDNGLQWGFEEGLGVRLSILLFF